MGTAGFEPRIFSLSYDKERSCGHDDFRRHGRPSSYTPWKFGVGAQEREKRLLRSLVNDYEFSGIPSQTPDFLPIGQHQLTMLRLGASEKL